MQLEFFHTYDEYRQANRAYARMNKLRWLIRTLFTALFLLIALLMLYFLVVSRKSAETGKIGWTNITPILPWLIVCGAMLAWALLGGSIALRRAWRGQPGMQLRQTLVINDAGLMVSDAQSRNEYTWGAFNRLLETRNLFLLFPSDLIFIIIPKRVVPPDQLQELRRLLDDRIRRASAFPVLPPKPPSA